MPAILLALALLEGNEVLAPSYLYVLGTIITIARLSHCGQLFAGPETVPMPFRMAGALTTFAFMLVTALLLILLGLQVCNISRLYIYIYTDTKHEQNESLQQSMFTALCIPNTPTLQPYKVDRLQSCSKAVVESMQGGCRDKRDS